MGREGGGEGSGAGVANLNPAATGGWVGEGGDEGGGAEGDAVSRGVRVGV